MAKNKFREKKYSPGSWIVYEDQHRETGFPCFSVRANNGKDVLFKTTENENEPPASKTALANVTLASKAPEMYELLKALEKDLYTSGGCNYLSEENHNRINNLLGIIKKKLDEI
jgi:hypothetical protein